MSRPRLPLRLSAREGAIEVARALDPALASRLRGGRKLTELSPDLDDKENAALAAALVASGVEPLVAELCAATNWDRRRRRNGGRKGAPARDWLRRTLGALRDVLRERLGERGDERRAVRVIACLVLLHELDQLPAFWRADGSPPPVGRARLGWLVERLGDLLDDGVGQYAARRA